MPDLPLFVFHNLAGITHLVQISTHKSTCLCEYICLYVHEMSFQRDVKLLR